MNLHISYCVVKTSLFKSLLQQSSQYINSSQHHIITIKKDYTHKINLPSSDTHSVHQSRCKQCSKQTANDYGNRKLHYYQNQNIHKTNIKLFGHQ